jgi:hypothetical protein
MLWAEGVVLYEQVDPMIERGIIATSRLLISDGETISFPRVSNIMSALHRSDTDMLKDIKLHKKDFNEIKLSSGESFDRFWNVRHLHIDINDERYDKQFAIMHSCMGPPAVAELFSNIERISQTLEKFSKSIVKPTLIKAQLVYE